jgi:hypothetical protein
MADVKVKKPKLPKDVVINDMTFVAPNRNRKDAGDLKSAIVRAESIYVPNRSQLYDTYHDILTIDGHLSGIIKKRTDAIKNKRIHYVDKNGKKVDAYDDLIKSKKFRRIIELTMESKYWGISGVQFIVGKDFDYIEIPRKHIRPEAGVITKSQFDFSGTDYLQDKFINVIGNPKDLGILLQCSLYALYKRSGFGDFAQYVELFGQPVRIIYYDAYDTQTKNELRKILNESGGSLAMMVPKQAKFEMLDGKTSNGTGELQTRLIGACNDEMSIAVLGNTETSKSSASSGYAQSKTHADQQLEITKSDLAFIEEELNEPWFKDVLAAYGFPVDGKFEFEKELDLDALKTRMEIDKFVAEKVPVGDDYYYETYGVPKPDNYDELKAKQEADKLALQNPPSPQGEGSGVRSKSPDKKPTAKPKNLADRITDSVLSFFGLAPRNNGAHLDF